MRTFICRFSFYALHGAVLFYWLSNTAGANLPNSAEINNVASNIVFLSATGFCLTVPAGLGSKLKKE